MSNSPEDYGTTIGTVAGPSRWFNGEPNLTRERLVPVMVRWICPMDGCGGEMKPAGFTWPMSPPGNHHKCTGCGFMAALRGKCYPAIEYEEKE